MIDNSKYYQNQDNEKEHNMHINLFADDLIEGIKPGDHACFFYDNDEDYNYITFSFMVKGFELKHRVIFITDSSTDKILKILKDKLVEPEKLISNNQLIFISSGEFYNFTNSNNLDRSILFANEETKRALSEGYTALRIIGEFRTLTKKNEEFINILEYESKINQFFKSSQCLALCQYDIRQFKKDFLVNILYRHPYIITGKNLFKNFYYLPPETLETDNYDNLFFFNCLNNLKRYYESVSKLKESEKTYKNIFSSLSLGCGLHEIIYDKDNEPVDFSFIEVNKEFENPTNTKSENVIGKTIKEIHPDFDKKLIQIYGAVASS